MFFKKIADWFMVDATLRADAKSKGFPLSMHGKYIYALKLDCFKKPWYQTWLSTIYDEDGIFTLPLVSDGNMVGTYYLIKRYRSSIHNRHSDYHHDDSGYYGDFRLMRIDKIGENNERI